MAPEPFSASSYRDTCRGLGADQLAWDYIHMYDNHASFQEDLAVPNATKSCFVTMNIVNFDCPRKKVMLKCQVFGLTKSTYTIVG
jgi:hypothetical protein